MAMTFELSQTTDGYMPPMHVVNLDPETFIAETQEAGQKVLVHKEVVGELCQQVVEVDLVPDPDH